MKICQGFLALGVLFCVSTQPAGSVTNPDSAALPPMGYTVFCRAYPGECRTTLPDHRARQNLPERFRQLTTVHSAVNAAIQPKDDADYIERDWTIWPAEGDCDDYAVTKRHELIKLGWASSELLLAEVTVIATGEHHLVLIARGVKADWVLDNLRQEVARFSEIQNDYIWDRMETADNPGLWTTSFAGLRHS